MATANAARGPLTLLLQSSSGQYLALGVGVYALFPDRVKQALAPLLGHPAIASQLGNDYGGNFRGQQQPIIIQTPSPTVIHRDGSRSQSLTTIVIYSMAGAGACWVGYIVCSQLLPDAVSEFMPVTKRLFQQTTQTLGKGILQVKELLEDQISQLLGQQEALEKRQEDTHNSVKEVQSELGEARFDLANLQHSLDRCEAGLEHSSNMQGYTLRGIKLLVRCVTSFLPDESNFIDDISRYIEDGTGGSNSNTMDHPGALTRSQSQPGPQSYHRGAAPALPSMNAGGGGIVGRSTSMPPTVSHPLPEKFFSSQDYPSAMQDSSVPSITSVDSEEDDTTASSSSKGGAKTFSMRDIRALLGH